MTQGMDPFPAQVEISQLQTGITPDGSELIEVVQSGVSVQLTLNDIAPVFLNSITGATAQVLRIGSDGALDFGAVNLATTVAVTGVLPTINGGIGFTTAGTGTLLSMLNATTITTISVVPFSTGGLGFTTAPANSILAALNATTITTLAAGTAQVLRADASSVVGWGAVNLATTAAVTGILPLSSGGVGFTTAVSGSILNMLNATTVTTLTGVQSAIVGFANATTATVFPIGQLPGIATATDASTGNIGEYLSTTLPVASTKALTSGTATSVISLALSPGDWDVFPVIGFTGHTSTLVYYGAGSLSDSSTVLNTTIGEGVSIPGFNLAMFTSTTVVNTPTVAVPPVRRSLTATTTVWLTAQMGFATSTAGAFGAIRARRSR